MTYVLLDSATARVDVPDVSVKDLQARFVVDGEEIGRCSREWLHKGVDCQLGDFGVELSAALRAELTVEADGRVLGKATLDTATVHGRGELTVQLVTTGKLRSASVKLYARESPIVPLPVAQAIDAVAGLLLAAVLSTVARRHLHLLATFAVVI